MSLAYSASTDCVIDASVGIKLFLVEPLSDRAEALFDYLDDDSPPRFYVPDLFYVECANILWKYVRRFGYPLQSAQQDAADLIELPLQVVPTAALVEHALALATLHNISAYDAAYLALGDRLSLPMVTADSKLVRRLQETDLDVRFLGDWP
ncbi:MAG: type II toxin-antitoxin system VapC family toxin [Anaerolineae bacterium]|nr:type II toxin-antitoxin system VapC family toxin [Anaerolineae bacterium]